MKKRIVLLSILALLSCTLTACGHSHEWKDATCDAPKTCAGCEETEGEALGHSWVEADCETAKTCSACGKTEGEALGHKLEQYTLNTDNSIMSGTCLNCGEVIEQPVDWNAFAAANFRGYWSGRWHYYDYNNEEPDHGNYEVAARQPVYADFRENGTVELYVHGMSHIEGELQCQAFDGELIQYKIIDADSGKVRYFFYHTGYEFIYMVFPLEGDVGEVKIFLEKYQEEDAELFEGIWYCVNYLFVDDKTLEFAGSDSLTIDSTIQGHYLYLGKYSYEELLETNYQNLYCMENVESCHVIAYYDDQWNYQGELSVIKNGENMNIFRLYNNNSMLLNYSRNKQENALASSLEQALQQAAEQASQQAGQ